MIFAIEVDLKLQNCRSFSSAKSKFLLPPIKTENITKVENATKDNLPIKKLTPEEIQYKRQNNLCFYCNEKFVRDHKCARKQILLLDLGYSSSEEEEIMQDDGLVRKLSLAVDTSEIFDVMIGDGGQVKSKGACTAVTLKIDQYNYTSDMLVLPLGGCDIVLGIQWLRTLGPILWDFEKLTMEFWHQGTKVVLSSSKPQTIQLVSTQQMDRKFYSESCYGALLCSIDGVMAKEESIVLSPQQQKELQDLQDSFSTIFSAPTTLPPERNHDHRIPLVPNCKPPSIRSYAYAFTSKVLGPRNQALSTYERELIVIVHAIKKWQHYLQGRHFVIKTDHYSLKYFLNQNANTPFQQKWVTKLLGYDYEILYRQGVDKKVVDALSRFPVDSCQHITTTEVVLQQISFEPLPTDHDHCPINMAISYPYHSWMDDLRRFNKADPWIQKKIQELTTHVREANDTSQSVSHANHLKNFVVDNGLLKFKYRIVLNPNSEWIPKVFQAHHSIPVAGENVSPTLNLPLIIEDGIVQDEPVAILERKMVKRGNATGVDVLVH
ncbi:hypothetical protein LWI29_036834 [Acer saccharum]|uniref:Reverse transcriptase RNase H-like domain-containing protein n=1 Tax=Acer saccharum TaxID=4024 RepID=A0AA39RPG9_ACESA|nr:hypothetical protein LWI29_036834 [Acer saccharum]